jgi:hypothetical protein
VTRITFQDGKVVLRDGQVGTEEACCCETGACCADDGTCSQTTEGDCSGTWHEGVDCDDIDCTSGCCELVTSSNGDCPYFRCVRGRTDDCESPPCDPDEPTPQLPIPDCAGGGSATVTVTGSGYVANSGTQPLDDDLNRLMNDSYVVDLDCFGEGSFLVVDGGYTVEVDVSLARDRGAVIRVIDRAAMGFSPPPDTPTTTDCNATIFPCGPFSGAVNFTSGIGEFTGANINVSV